MSNVIADEELIPDPITGEFVSVSTAVLEKRGSLKRSYKKGGKGYSATVTLDGYKVYLGDVTPESLEALQNANAKWQDDMQQLGIDQKPKALPSGKNAKPKLSPPQAREKSKKITEERHAAYYKSLKLWVMDWELPDDEEGSILPCTPETIEDLPFPAAFDLAIAIQQTMNLGKDAAAFLATA